MLERAKGSEATTGVKIVETPLASALEQALTKDTSAAQITLSLTDTTVLTATRTAIDVKSGVGVWRGTIDPAGGQVVLMWWPNGQMAGMVQHEGRFYAIRHMGTAACDRRDGC